MNVRYKRITISLALLALISGLVWFFGFSQTDESSTADSQASSNGSLTAEVVNELADKLVSQDHATYEAAWAHDNVPPLSPSGTTIVVDTDTVQSHETAGVATITVTVPGEDPVQEAVLLQQTDGEWRVYSMLEVVLDAAPRVSTTLSSASEEGAGEAYSSTAVLDDEPPCAADLGIKAPNAGDATAKTPLIMVHGFKGKAGTWTEGDNPMSKTFESISDVKPVYFDYEPANDRWVTDPKIAQKLAKIIVCYSILYGGKDVELATHSMGALAVRAALDEASDGTFAKDVTKHIVTIAPPHTGAGVASLDATFWKSVCEDPLLVATLIAGEACNEAEVTRATNGLQIDSDQLAKLPKFPKGISVKTIAGHATWRVCIAWACSPGVDMNGDLVVSVDSATADYTTDKAGDGKKVFTCDTDTIFAPLSSAWCEHSNMLEAKEVQKEVKGSIEASLESDSGYKVSPELPPHKDTELFGKLSLPYLNQWAQAMSEPSVMNLVDNTNCDANEFSTAECPHIQIFNLDTGYGRDTYGDDPIGKAALENCFADGGDAYGKLKHKLTIHVDGEQVEYHEQVLCPKNIQPQTTHYVWYIKSRDVLIMATDSEHPIAIEDLRASIANIKWL